MTWNYYKDAYDNKNYDLATSYLPTLLDKCPKALQNIYVYGINIYKQKIARATNLTEKKSLVDSLLLLYDKRIEFFGDRKPGAERIMELKAKDYLALNPADREGMMRYFTEAINFGNNSQNIDLINIYFNELTEDFKNEILETEAYMDEYQTLSEFVAVNTDPELEGARTTFDNLFISSGAANCENLEKLFKARLERSPEDIDAIAKAFSLLSRRECYTPFYFEVGEKYFKNQPSSGTAMLLATAYEKAGNIDKSIEFLRAAVQNETNAADKAKLCIQISGTELRAGHPRNAADFAQQAIDIDPSNGFGYMLLAHSYAAGASQCADFDRQTVYWLAYDVLVKARRVFAEDDAQLKIIDESMSTYRANFPRQEECFFRGLTTEGVPYDVRCGWIVGRTSVKQGR